MGRAAVSLPDRTAVTLRFPRRRRGEIPDRRDPEQALADDKDDVVTARSPLGQAWSGDAPDTVTYRGQDGDLQAEVVAVRVPRARGRNVDTAARREVGLSRVRPTLRK
jgi:hypothetical protein